MKKKITILISVLLILMIMGVIYYFTPKTFGKGVDPASVDHINVFDGNTGEGFTIDDEKHNQKGDNFSSYICSDLHIVWSYHWLA